MTTTTKRPTIPRRELAARIAEALEDDDRARIKTLDDETTNPKIKRVLRAADNTLVFRQRDNPEQEHKYAVETIEALLEVDE